MLSLDDSASPNKPLTQACVMAASAGSCISFVALERGAGAAFFAWSEADPYEQLSDAYTFMETRKIHPGAGDHLYSTLRRPILTVTRDDAGHSVDLLRHDHWHPRRVCIDTLEAEARALSLHSPFRRDWPYAVNIFAHTGVSVLGELSDMALSVREGSRVELTARFDIVIAVLAASRGKLMLQINGAAI